MDFIIGYVLTVLVTFGVSSILLYGSIFQWLRTWWLNKKWILKDLMACQLCISVWVSSAIQWYILGCSDPILYFMISCSVAGLSWMLGAFTQAALWQRALHERWYGKK